MTKEAKSSNLISRLFKLLLSVIVISALVVGIIVFVKELSEFDNKSLVSFSEKLLAKTGISDKHIGQVAGVISKFDNPEQAVLPDAKSTPTESFPTENVMSKPEVTARIAVMSDIENDTSNFTKALARAADLKITHIVLLGDLTNWGDVTSLELVKKNLDNTRIKYSVIPGDHDLAASVYEGDISGMQNFNQIFGKDYHLISIGNLQILILNNSANYTVVNDINIKNFEADLKSSNIVMLSQPVLPLLGSRSMGLIDGEEVVAVKNQADAILNAIRESNVSAVFSGDLHYAKKFQDTADHTLSFYSVGAITDNPNLGTPSFNVLTVFSDGTYTVSLSEL